VFPTSGRAADAAGLFQRLQRLAQAFILYRQRVAELASRQHAPLGKKIEDLLLEAASILVLQLSDDLQMCRLGLVGD
jgi:hypothetical protein